MIFCSFLPESSSDILGVNRRITLGQCSYKEAVKNTRDLVSNDIMLDKNNGIKPRKDFYSEKGKFTSLCERNSLLNGVDHICTQTSHILFTKTEREDTTQGDWLSDQRLFSYAICGILSFSCVTVIQPQDLTARFLMSFDCSFFNDWIVGSGVTSDGLNVADVDAITSKLNSYPSRLYVAILLFWFSFA